MFVVSIPAGALFYGETRHGAVSCGGETRGVRPKDASLSRHIIGTGSAVHSTHMVVNTRTSTIMISAIKTSEHYQEVLDRVAVLAALDPIAESENGRELEVLTVLLKDFEHREHPLAPASPLAAQTSYGAAGSLP